MIVIIDYGMGNCGSVKRMIEEVGGEATISDDIAIIAKASKLIIPGVGSFDDGMHNLEKKGIKKILQEKVVKEKTPLLGICLGMQLLAKSSEEGKEKGLGFIDAQVIKFKKDKSNLKIPHMGWNYITIKKESKLLENIPEKPRFYFVHSYYMKNNQEKDIGATSQYGIEFCAAVEKDNIYGTQFHPEKSHKYGMAIIKNFVENV